MKDKYLFFWGHRKSGKPFSNWLPCQFKINGVEYNCTEQHMMHQKALLFNDIEIADKILQSNSPANQKKLGRQVKNFDPAIWDTNARTIVYEGNKAKYTQNPELLTILLKSAPLILVEASPYDKVWGIGLMEGDPKTFDETQWQGKNWLGEVLTKLRDDYIKATKANTIVDLDLLTF